MILKLYSRIAANGKRVYEFELDSCIGNYNTNSVPELINTISEGSVRLYQGRQTIYKYFSTSLRTGPIVFLAECEFTDIDDMRSNLKTVLHRDYPELLI